MKRKILIVLMAVVLFTSSLILPQKKVEAEAFTIAAGGTAISATAVYVIGALAVGGLATAVGIEYGDEINAHAKSVWDSASDTVKSAFASAVAGAKNGYLTLSGSLKDWFKSATDTVTSKLVVGNQNENTGLRWSKYTLTATCCNYSHHYVGFSETIQMNNHRYVIYTPSGLRVYSKINVTMRLDGGFKVDDGNGNSLLPYLIPGFTGSIYYLDTYVSVDFANAVLNMLTQTETPQDVANVFNKVGFTPSTILSVDQINSYYNNVVTNRNTIFGSGTLGLNLPSDKIYVPTAPNGQTLTQQPDGTWTYPNGDVYVGDVGYTLPNLKVLDVDGVRTPVLPVLDMPGYYIDIQTGKYITTLEGDVATDTPFPPGIVVEDKPTSEIGGFFGKLWEWLKKILDAILGLPAKIIELLGALLTGLLSTLFVPSETFWSDNFGQIKLLLQDKLDTDSYTSVLDSIKNITSPTFSDVKIPSIMGSGEMVIIKASYINNSLPTIHNWIKGLFFVLLVFYNLNNVYKLLRGGDITSAVERRERSNKD